MKRFCQSPALPKHPEGCLLETHSGVPFRRALFDSSYQDIIAAPTSSKIMLSRPVSCLLRTLSICCCFSLTCSCCGKSFRFTAGRLVGVPNRIYSFCFGLSQAILCRVLAVPRRDLSYCYLLFHLEYFQRAFCLTLKIYIPRKASKAA